MYLVGLTGGIATGKSTVSAIFREHGIPVIDADKIAVEVVEPGQLAYTQLREAFGDDIFDANSGGALDREKLGRMVFSDPEVRRKVNGITHPAIRKGIMLQLWKHFLGGAKFVVLDLPLLFEVGYDKILQKIIVVECTEEQQLLRLQSRNNFDTAAARARISAQMPLAEKVKRATHVVDNSGDEEATKAQVERIIRELESSRLYLIVRVVLLILAVAALFIFLAFFVL